MVSVPMFGSKSVSAAILSFSATTSTPVLIARKSWERRGWGAEETDSCAICSASSSCRIRLLISSTLLCSLSVFARTYLSHCSDQQKKMHHGGEVPWSLSGGEGAYICTYTKLLFTNRSESKCLTIRAYRGTSSTKTRRARNLWDNVWNLSSLHCNKEILTFLSHLSFSLHDVAKSS